MHIGTKLLEDNSTLLQLQMENPESPDSLKAPHAYLISIFAIQPRNDFLDASENLFYVANQPGIQVIRQVFSTKLSNPKNWQKDSSYTGLLLLIRVIYDFQVRSYRTLPTLLREARKEFVKRRSRTHTILEAAGCKTSLITGKNLIKTHLYGNLNIPEGISVFKGRKGFHSKLIEPFLRLDRVPSREIQKFTSPSLPIKHKVGYRIDDFTRSVGFPNLEKGTILITGSNNSEVISILQVLLHSFSKTTEHIFIIDTQGEFNGIIKYFQENPSNLGNLNLQVFRLGINMHLNLCDVIIPLSPTGKEKEAKARASWKAHLISQILLSSLSTSDYLTARYAIPLETQIKSTAESDSIFTLRDIKLTVSSANVAGVEVDTEGIDMLFADMMAIDALAGILEQFSSFPEINYSSFIGHYSNTLSREKTITFFQFGAQPPMIQKATVAFLLHYLSETMHNGCLFLTHSTEFLSRKTIYRREKDFISSSIIDTCNLLSRRNVLILGNNSLQALVTNLDSFDEIKNRIYLRLTNSLDREILISHHQLNLFLDHHPSYNSRRDVPYHQEQFLGIMEQEGLLFREDAPQNVAFHFKTEKIFPIDLEPVLVQEGRKRGSETLGLTPTRYETLMKLLKLLNTQPCRRDEAISLIEGTKQGALSLNLFRPLGLYSENIDSGTTYWIINQKGREFYNKQHNFLNQLPVPLTNEEFKKVPEELQRLEAFYDISSSRTDRLEVNTRIKTLIGRLLNYLRHLRISIPWNHVAKYYDLYTINTLEWQDFKNLFDLSHSLANNLMLEIIQIQKQLSEEEIYESLQQTSIQSSTKEKNLDDYLPEENFYTLQRISRELELETYPKTSILDIYYALHSKRGVLFDELKENMGEKKNND